MNFSSYETIIGMRFFKIQRDDKKYVVIKLKNFLVEWLERWEGERHGLGSKPTRAILLCPWERYFTTLSLLGGLSKQLYFY